MRRPRTLFSVKRNDRVTKMACQEERLHCPAPRAFWARGLSVLTVVRVMWCIDELNGYHT